MRSIGSIGNYYGGLNVKEEGDQYYWSIEDHSGHEWEEIPKTLYDQLIEFDEGPRIRFTTATYENVQIDSLGRVLGPVDPTKPMKIPEGM